MQSIVPAVVMICIDTAAHVREDGWLLLHQGVRRDAPQADAPAHGAPHRVEADTYGARSPDGVVQPAERAGALVTPNSKTGCMCYSSISTCPPGPNFHFQRQGTGQCVYNQFPSECREINHISSPYKSQRLPSLAYQSAATAIASPSAIPACDSASRDPCEP